MDILEYELSRSAILWAGKIREGFCEEVTFAT
jgi:hypothetical protein